MKASIGIRPLVNRMAVTLTLLTALLALSTPAKAGIGLFGGSLAWTSYGHTFTSAYNSGTIGTYLNEFKSNHLNYVRVWVCEGLDGLTIDGNGNCTGISSQLISNVQNFVWQANNLGITVEFVFINYQDVLNHPNLVTNSNNMWSLINNGLVPLGKAVQGYNCQFDLINEGDHSVSYVGWGYLRQWVINAKWALNQNGVNRWVTMSDSNYADLTNNLSGTVGGLGLNFYEYHMYNDQGWCPVASYLGGVPVELNEFGAATPAEGWNHNSYTFNKALLGNFMNNAQSQGYICAAFWSYINDGDYQLRGNQLMGDVSWWGAYFGH